jgi:hypothetical protein
LAPRQLFLPAPLSSTSAVIAAEARRHKGKLISGVLAVVALIA